MKDYRLLPATLISLAVLSTGAAPLAQGAPTPSTADASQAEAIKRFPELGKEGSVFRQAFLERAAKYRRESPQVMEKPTWPLKVAEEVAAGLTTHAEEALKVTREPDPDPGRDANDNSIRVQIENLGTTRAIDAQIKVSYAVGEPVVEKRHFEPSSTQTYSYANAQKNVKNVEIVSAVFTRNAAPRPPSAIAKPRPEGEYGIPVPGKPGFVKSPFSPDAGFVDVRGFPTGAQVKDPYSGEMFLVP